MVTRLLALAISHPVVFAKLTALIATDAKALSGLVAAVKAGPAAERAWALANQPLVQGFITQIDDDLQADPTLYPALVNALDPAPAETVPS